jgi:hypothetical protein
MPTFKRQYIYIEKRTRDSDCARGDGGVDRLAPRADETPEEAD